MKKNNGLEGVIAKLNEITRELYGMIPDGDTIKKEAKFNYTNHDRIINGVCEFWNISHADLVEYRRNKNLVERRKLTARLLHMYTDRTTTQIASLLGYKNHATVLHHLKKMEEELSLEFYGSGDTKKLYKQLLTHLKL